MSALLKMHRISERNGDIKSFPISNIKRLNVGKDGWGEVTIAVDNDTIKQLLLNKSVGGLLITTQEEWDKEVEE